MAVGAVHVRGLTELMRAFGVADEALKADLKDALSEAAQPVRAEAQRLAGQIRNVRGDHRPWARMRVGLYQSVVYVAPAERGVRNGPRRRPRFADLMLDRAMEPALESHKSETKRRLEQMINEVVTVWERS